MFVSVCVLFFCHDTATTEIYTYVHTLSLHDALPIFAPDGALRIDRHEEVAHALGSVVAPVQRLDLRAERPAGHRRTQHFYGQGQAVALMDADRQDPAVHSRLGIGRRAAVAVGGASLGARLSGLMGMTQTIGRVGGRGGGGEYG